MGIFGTIGSLTKKINGNDGGNNPMSILLNMMGIAASGQMLIQDTIDMVSGKNKKDVVIPPPPPRPDFSSNFNELITSQRNLSSTIKGSISNINKPATSISTRVTNISDSIKESDPVNNIKSDLDPENGGNIVNEINANTFNQVNASKQLMNSKLDVIIKSLELTNEVDNKSDEMIAEQLSTLNQGDISILQSIDGLNQKTSDDASYVTNTVSERMDYNNVLVINQVASLQNALAGGKKGFFSKILSNIKALPSMITNAVTPYINGQKANDLRRIVMDKAEEIGRITGFLVTGVQILMSLFDKQVSKVEDLLFENPIIRGIAKSAGVNLDKIDVDRATKKNKVKSVEGISPQIDTWKKESANRRKEFFKDELKEFEYLAKNRYSILVKLYGAASLNAMGILENDISKFVELYSEARTKGNPKTIRNDTLNKINFPFISKERTYEKDLQLINEEIKVQGGSDKELSKVKSKVKSEDKVAAFYSEEIDKTTSQIEEQKRIISMDADISESDKTEIQRELSNAEAEYKETVKKSAEGQVNSKKVVVDSGSNSSLLSNTDLNSAYQNYYSEVSGDTVTSINQEEDLSRLKGKVLFDKAGRAVKLTNGNKILSGTMTINDGSGLYSTEPVMPMQDPSNPDGPPISTYRYAQLVNNMASIHKDIPYTIETKVDDNGLYSYWLVNRKTGVKTNLSDIRVNFAEELYDKIVKAYGKSVNSSSRVNTGIESVGNELNYNPELREGTVNSTSENYKDIPNYLERFKESSTSNKDLSVRMDDLVSSINNSISNNDANGDLAQKIDQLSQLLIRSNESTVKYIDGKLAQLDDSVEGKVRSMTNDVVRKITVDNGISYNKRLGDR